MSSSYWLMARAENQGASTFLMTKYSGGSVSIGTWCFTPGMRGMWMPSAELKDSQSFMTCWHSLWPVMTQKPPQASDQLTGPSVVRNSVQIGYGSAAKAAEWWSKAALA